MRILHVGSGFRPLRRGGLVAYIEDLIDEQVRRGDEVAYVFAGRTYPFGRPPRLKRWTRGGVPMYEILDSPLYDHGRQPAGELDEPALERLFEEVLEEHRPDVVHVQEMAGLPSSVLDLAARRNIPTVVTLQDYFFLCPVFRLSDGHCTRRDVGAGCVATVAADPRRPGLMVDATVRHDLAYRVPVVRRFAGPWIERVAAKVSRRVPSPRAASAEEFQRRRAENVRRLSEADVVVAMSHRVAELHDQAGVETERMRVVHLTLAHIERLRPKDPAVGDPIRFGTLAAFESEAKGGRLLLDAVRQLDPGRFRVVVYGHVEAEFAREAEQLETIEVRAPFAPDQLDAILDDVDVGLMPSVWEEAYGYAGVEFLAKGIPVVANAIGGMPDYVRDGETGWLNRSLGADELAGIMRSIIERPEQVAELSAKVNAARSAIVKPMARHAEEMGAIYAEVTAARHNAPP